MAGASAEERGQTHENRDGLYLLFQALAPTFKFNACNCHLTLRICIVVDVHSDRKEFSACCSLTWLLDLSAAFGTVDHTVSLRRLQTSFGISGAPLDWFKSYLSARRQRVSIPGALSGSLPLDWGVPQGSCLGVLLYFIHSSKLFSIIECRLPNSHCYADDSQLYFSFKPGDLSSQQDAITTMQSFIDDIRSWMEHDNDEKTEFLIIGTRQQLSKVNISSITVGNSVIMKSSVVRNLGSYVDDKQSMNSHINKSIMHDFIIFTTLGR